MEKTYTKVTEEKQSGYRVESSCETIHIDMSGNVISLTHDTSCCAGGGFCTYTEDNDDFRIQVRFFMEQLLEKDLKEFKNMRNVLTGEWYEMAESVRKHAVSKFNF